MYLLGLDIGSSSVKASVIEASSGNVVGSAFSPDVEMEMLAQQSGWAEQDPEKWVENAILSLRKIKSSGVDLSLIQAVGIAYQMHGLVLLDQEGALVRPSIIWCDSRAVEIGSKAFQDLGSDYCLAHLLNSPGNFTASKLKWVQRHEPNLYQKVYKMMLPGDYMAYRLTGEMNTTLSGLSEGMLWDFKQGRVAIDLLDYYGINPEKIATQVDTFSIQGLVTKEAAALFDIPSGIPVSYRAGDQPNNAFSLNVLQPGEIAATAGTSGVVYGVSDVVKYDPASRVNTFAHVNHSENLNRLGVLLCVNGTGILNSWMKKHAAESLTYAEMNALAEKVAIGSDGLQIIPFGNGAERVLENREPGASIQNLNFNMHGQGHLFRAAQEGIVFSFQYGLEVMAGMGIQPRVIRAGKANMFLSPVFRETLAGVSGASIELYDTDGAKGAALGAGIGSGIYKAPEEAFVHLKKLETVEPDTTKTARYKEAYSHWKQTLSSFCL